MQEPYGYHTDPIGQACAQELYHRDPTPEKTMQNHRRDGTLEACLFTTEPRPLARVALYLIQELFPFFFGGAVYNKQFPWRCIQYATCANNLAVKIIYGLPGKLFSNIRVYR